AVPVWTRVLKPGGALGISWNDLVLPRAELLDILSRAGLKPREGAPYEQFARRVDHAIVRDLVVATKPAWCRAERGGWRGGVRAGGSAARGGEGRPGQRRRSTRR